MHGSAVLVVEGRCTSGTSACERMVPHRSRVLQEHAVLVALVLRAEGRFVRHPHSSLRKCLLEVVNGCLDYL